MFIASARRELPFVTDSGTPYRSEDRLSKVGRNTGEAKNQKAEMGKRESSVGRALRTRLNFTKKNLNSLSLPRAHQCKRIADPGKGR